MVSLKCIVCLKLVCVSDDLVKPDYVCGGCLHGDEGTPYLDRIIAAEHDDEDTELEWDEDGGPFDIS